MLLGVVARPALTQQPSSTPRPPEPSIEALLTQVADTSQRVQLQAYRTARQMGPRSAEAVPALLPLLKDPRPHVRSGAVAALRGIAQGGHLPASTLPLLLPALSDSEAYTRRNAARLLAEVAPRDPRVIAALSKALQSDPDLDVRIIAAFELGESGDPAVIPELVRLAEDSTLRSPEAPRGTNTARAQAVNALRPFGRRALPAFTSLLKNPTPEVRVAAARQLAALGPEAKGAVPTLATLVTDADSVVAGVAANALARIVPRMDMHTITMRAQVMSEGHSLRDDGRGAYVNAVDSTSVNVCEGINIFLGVAPGRGACADQQYRPTRLHNWNRSGLRTLTFDLNDPVQGSGAERLGVITDERAEVHALWKRIPKVEIFKPITLPRGEDSLFSDRVQLHLTINGRRHQLQFGPWVQGEFLTTQAKIHGEGTTRAKIARPSETQFRVVAPAGSIGRLWDVQDMDEPVDRGLYHFSFDILWEMLGNP